MSTTLLLLLLLSRGNMEGLLQITHPFPLDVEVYSAQCEFIASPLQMSNFKLNVEKNMSGVEICRL